MKEILQKSQEVLASLTAKAEVTAPTTTVINKTTYIGTVYNATDSKGDILAVATQE